MLYDPNDHSKVAFDSVRVAAGYAEKLQRSKVATEQAKQLQTNSAVPPPPPPSVPAGWYSDPNNGQLQRYWDGTIWTEHTAPLV